MKIIKPGLVALLTSAAIYGSFGVMIRLLSYELSLTSQVIFRYSLALVILISMVLVTKAKLKFKKESIMPMLGLALFMQISITNFTKAALLIPISSLIGAFYIGSLVTATLTGIFVYKEKISWTGASSTLLAGLGLWLLTLNGGNFAGLILAIIAGSAESVTQAIRKSAPNLSKGVTAVIAIFGILMFTLLQNIFNSWEIIRFSENTIKHLHQELLKYIEKDQGHRGKYKSTDNKVEMVDEKGRRIGVIFDTTPAYLTPKQMQELQES